MAYGYYRAITIDHTKCGSSNSTDFPVLVAGTYTYLKTVGNGGKVESSSGYDIQFFSDSGLTTALKFERVSWGAATGTVEFWVKVPTLSASTDTVIYMAYGNAAISTDQQDAANTWSNSYVSAYHFGDGTTLSVADALNSINGTNHSTTATTGKVGGGVALSGSSQYVDLGDPTGVDFGSGDYAFRVWLKPATGTLVNTTRMMVLGKDSVFSARQLTIEINDGKGAGTVGAIGTFAFAGGGGTYYGAHTGTNALTENVWQLVRIQRNGNAWECYINGSSVTFSTAGSSLPQTMDATAVGLNIGRRDTGGAYDDYFNGSMDELFIESTARSSSWATSEYNNQNSPSTFYSVGAEQSSGTTYTLTATTGSYSLSASSTGIKIVRGLAATTASYSLSASATGVKINRGLTATTASYSLSASSAGVNVARGLTATTATYVIDASATGFTIGKVLSAATAAYSLSASATGINIVRSLTAATGAYVIDGSAIGLYKAKTLIADAAVYTLSATATSINIARRLTADAAAYTLSATAAALAFERRLSAATASYLLSASSTGVYYIRKVTAAVGSFVLSASDVAVYLVTNTTALYGKARVALQRGARAAETNKTKVAPPNSGRVTNAD